MWNISDIFQPPKNSPLLLTLTYFGPMVSLKEELKRRDKKAQHDKDPSRADNTGSMDACSFVKIQVVFQGKKLARLRHVSQKNAFV